MKPGFCSLTQTPNWLPTLWQTIYDIRTAAKLSVPSRKFGFHLINCALSPSFKRGYLPIWGFPIKTLLVEIIAVHLTGVIRGSEWRQGHKLQPEQAHQSEHTAPFRGQNGTIFEEPSQALKWAMYDDQCPAALCSSFDARQVGRNGLFSAAGVGKIANGCVALQDFDEFANVVWFAPGRTLKNVILPLSSVFRFDFYSASLCR